MALQTRSGTSGYSYKEWQGVFYPDDLAPDAWLSYYATQLPSVEINNTFYRMPRTHVVESWRDAVPASFRFVLKASRRITHQSRLQNCEEATGYLLERAETMGEKLGAILFQLPPSMRADLDRLESFQSLLPEGLSAAFEFRHDSWQDADVDRLLRARGHARVIAHDEGATSAPVPANDLVYLRLRAPEYTDVALHEWHDRVLASGARNAYVFFKHEDDAAGPAMACRYLQIAGAAAKAQPKAPRRAAAKAVRTPKKAGAAQTKPATPEKAAQAAPKKATAKRGQKKTG